MQEFVADMTPFRPDERFGHPAIQALRRRPGRKVLLHGWLDIPVSERRGIVSAWKVDSWCDCRGTRTFNFTYDPQVENFRHHMKVIYDLDSEEITYEA